MNQEPNFDFIMNPQKNRGGSFGANSQKQRIMVVAVAGALLLVVVLIIGGILSRVGGQANEQVLDLVAYQSELKRVIGIGSEKARSSATKNKAVTATYTLESDYRLSVQMMNARGISPPKDLTARYGGGNSDEILDKAEKNNEFDKVYEELYKEKLTNYKSKLAEIYPSLSPGEQETLKAQNNNVKLLLGEPLDTPQE